MVGQVTDAELEKLNMEILEGCPSEKELWNIAIDLLAEVKRLRRDEKIIEDEWDKAQEENARLREALQWIVDIDKRNVYPCTHKARRALEGRDE